MKEITGANIEQGSAKEEQQMGLPFFPYVLNEIREMKKHYVLFYQTWRTGRALVIVICSMVERSLMVKGR